MSFNPPIIICLDDFKNHKDDVDYHNFQCLPIPKKIPPTKILPAYDLLIQALYYNSIQFMGIEFVIIYPELTSINKQIQSILTNLNIKFTFDINH